MKPPEIDLSEFIRDRCFTAKGTLNNRILIDSWWVNRDLQSYKDLIIASTSELLGSDAGLSQRCYHVYTRADKIPTCKICDQPCEYLNFTAGYRKYCSAKCAANDPENIAKRTTKESRKKSLETQRRTNLERYGVEYSFMADSVKEKISRTKLLKYGSSTYNNQEKHRATCLERYDSEYWFTSADGAEYLKSLVKNNGGSLKLDSDTASKLNDMNLLIELNETMDLHEIAEHIGVSVSAVYKKFFAAGISYNRFASRHHLQETLIAKIRDFGVEATADDRSIIKPLELDIVIKDKKIAVEFNGMYWHSYGKHDEEDRFRHLRKLELANRAGYDLIQVTDKEYVEKQDLVMSMIRSRLGLYDRVIRAGKCSIRNVPTPEQKTFLEDNHIQGYVRSSKAFGLYLEDELVSIMTFGKSRYSRDHEYELLRFASRAGLKVHGAAGKLFKHFVRTARPSSIVSYCDISKFTGKMYESIGFNLIRRSLPNYVYFNSKGVYITRYQAQKHKLKDVLESFDPTLSESENMFSNGFRRYWDCGNNVYQWRR